LLRIPLGLKTLLIAAFGRYRSPVSEDFLPLLVVQSCLPPFRDCCGAFKLLLFQEVSLSICSSVIAYAKYWSTRFFKQTVFAELFNHDTLHQLALYFFGY
jgi:hypothetical protein